MEWMVSEIGKSLDIYLLYTLLQINIYLDPPRGAKWMVRGATKQPLRVQTPPLGGCWYIYIYLTHLSRSCAHFIG